MAYDPKAITEDQRSYAYKTMWLGLPFSIVLLICMQFEALEFLSTLVGGFVSGTFIALAWAWSHDEFVRGQIAFASNCALSFAGVVLFLQLVPIARDYPIGAGQAIAIMAVIFHVALAYRRIRDGELKETGE